MSKQRRWKERVTGVVDNRRTATDETEFCQQCRSHSNNPSLCVAHGYVGRKHTCTDFTRRS